MNQRKSIIILASSLSLACFLGARADTTEETNTTVTTTTTSSDAAVVTLSPNGSYILVDPITGSLKGNYDPSVSVTTLQSGLVVVDKPSGNLVAIVDPSGRIVDAGAVSANDVLVQSIATRRRDLDQEIKEGLNSGKLSTAQATDLRNQLNRIAADEAAGTFTYRRAFVAASDLNLLSQRLYPVAVTAPVISPQFVVVNERLTMVDPFTSRKMVLLVRIDDEYQAGRLSANQESRLKSDLDKISALETRYTKNGEISASKRQVIATKMDKVESCLGNDIANINEKRAKIGIRTD